ncbi:hypothetical protein ACLI07_15355 [Providencia huaxiensis]|uniref:hypothetical protein n=1 Tax=Providencia TaxID=586 RepID=UPI00234A5E51|nr:hypothetical protein [Providencia sp. PROV076]
MVSLIILSGCTQKYRDTILDITYALTGAPGAKHKTNGNNTTTTMKSKAQLEREKDEYEFKNRRQSWVGKSIDDLIMQRGSPFGVHKRQDGALSIPLRKRKTVLMTRTTKETLYFNLCHNGNIKAGRYQGSIDV